MNIVLGRLLQFKNIRILPTNKMLSSVGILNKITSSCVSSVAIKIKINVTVFLVNKFDPKYKVLLNLRNTYETYTKQIIFKVFIWIDNQKLVNDT